MTPEAILDRLLRLFPGFAAAWDSPDNSFREDVGSSTRCGVFAEFSHYFRDGYERFTPGQLAELGRFVTECVASADEGLGTAAATCFLENVAGERFGADFRRHLSGEALRFYLYWDGAA